MACNSTVPAATLFEKGMYIGINVQGILYGIELVLYLKTMRIYAARRQRPHKSDVFCAVFSTVMLVLITIWVGALSTFGQRMWLLDRNYPGGPMAYHTARSSDLYMIVGRSSLNCLQQMADALMIYRCWVVWYNRLIIVAPSILLWLVNFGLGAVLLWTSSMPRTTFFTGASVKLGLAYYSSSTFLNVTLTSMICCRLLLHARKVKNYLGQKHAYPYVAIAALVIESVLPLTLSSILFLVSYGMGSQSLVAVSFVHPLIMCISPQMLILRVAKAKAWPREVRVPPGHAESSSGHLDGNAMAHSPTLNVLQSQQQNNDQV